MSLSLKFMLFDSTRRVKKQYGFLVSSGFLLSRKVWWELQFVSFCTKFRYFEDQNGQNGDHMKINFDYIQIQKWMSRKVRAEKFYGKSEPFV